MPNTLKKAVQNALLLPRKKQYEKDLRRLFKEYETECEEIYSYVTSDEVVKETGLRVERINIKTLADNIRKQTEYDGSKFYIVYDKSFGILRKESERLIFEYISDNPYAEVIYGDEDYFALSGEFDEKEFLKAERAFRYYKPILSPETLASFDYINALTVKGSILNEVLKDDYIKTGFETYSESGILLYKLTVEIFAKLIKEGREKSVCHIPAVLVSREIRIEEKIKKELEESLDIGSILYPEYAQKAPLLSESMYSDIRKEAVEKLGLVPQNESPSVSVIIPSKDNPDMLISCIGKLKLTKDSEIEVIIVDNGSGSENKKKIEDYLDKCEFEYKYLYAVQEFNYSKMNNAGAHVAKGEVLLLLNDDVEAEGYGWIKKMASYATVKGVGCVGCKLLYPDGKIQHIGIAAGVDGPAHKFMGEEDNNKLGAGDNIVNKNVLAVTGACMAVRKEVYDKTGGLCEELKVGYNDVDFCMKLYEAGYRNVLLNEIKLIHHESVSRGKDAKNKNKSERLRNEKEILKKMHPSLMISDPYEGGSEDYRLRFSKEKEKTDINAKAVPDSRKANDEEGWIYSSFERLETVTQDDKKILAAKGFALVPGIDNMRFDFDIILEKDKRQYVIPVERNLRTDLAGRFNGSANTELCGMNIRADISALDSGTYSVLMYAKDHGNVRELITDTFQTIDI